MGLVIKYFILLSFFFVFVNTSFLQMEYLIYSQNENGKLFRRIVNGNEKIAVIPANDLKKFQYEGQEINLFDKVSDWMLSSTIYSGDYPVSNSLTKLPLNGILESYFDPSFYDTQFYISVGSFTSKCTSQITTDIACKTAHLVANLDLPPRGNCEKNTGLLTVNMPVIIRIRNTKLDLSLEMKSNRESKFWNIPGDASCPLHTEEILYKSVQASIYYLKNEYFPAIRTIPLYYIIEKDPDQKIDALLKEAIKKQAKRVRISDHTKRLWQKAYNLSRGKSDGALSNMAMYYLSIGEIELALEYFQMAENLNGPNKRFIRIIKNEVISIAGES
ncbi:hypothetical protein HGB47_15345 [Leptospira yasudae]|nr:hypothetical protein [Leptospira yasudae]